MKKRDILLGNGSTMLSDFPQMPFRWSTAPWRLTAMLQTGTVRFKGCKELSHSPALFRWHRSDIKSGVFSLHTCLFGTAQYFVVQRLEGNRYTSVLKVQLHKLFNLKRLRESDLSFFFFLLLFLLWDYQDTQDIGLLCRLTRTHFLSI